MHGACVIVRIVHCWRRVQLWSRGVRRILGVLAVARTHAADARCSAAVGCVGVVSIGIVWVVRHSGCSVTRSRGSTIWRSVEFGLVIAHAHRRVVTFLINRSRGEGSLVWVNVIDVGATTQVLVARQHAVEVVVLQGRDRDEGADTPENAIEGILVSSSC